MTYAHVLEAAGFLESRLAGPPAAAVIFGTGLTAVPRDLADRVEISYSEIPHWPRSTVAGHSGFLIAGRLGRSPVAMLAGRAHLYEGYAPSEVVFPTRVLKQLGARALVLTNASGAINPAFRPGQLVLISDHLNLMGVNPLTGPNEERFGPRFPDLSDVYPARLREIARQCGRALGLELAEGVYAGVAGPGFETPAEIRYLRAIGADLVGMSTVPEAIAAAHAGLPLLGISAVSNMAAGILPQKITHEEVLQAGERVRDTLAALLARAVPELVATP